MIQDDPMNQKSKKISNSGAMGGAEYLPLSNGSEEDIVTFQGIEVASETLITKDGPNINNTTNDKGVYYKFAMLISLYIMQGIPLGLVFGSIPYMLKSEKGNNLSYSQFGLFSLAGYPYSLKLLWSPIVDQIYNPRIGRRKSWILPVQCFVGGLFFLLGGRIDGWIVPGQRVNFWRLNGYFLLLATLCATLDVAVDGWALTLLPADKIHYASTCQSVGVNIGLFISFTIFLAGSSPRFCKQFLRIEGESGLFTLGSFMKFWAVIYFLSTVFLFFKKEDSTKSLRAKATTMDAWDTQDTRNTEDIRDTKDATITCTSSPGNTTISLFSSITKGYKTLWGIISLPTVRSFALILLCFKFGFSAYDAVAPLKLLEKGFPKEFLALTVLIDFPFQMIMGFFVAKWSAGPRTFRPWIYATYCRIVMSLIGLYVISKFPTGGLTTSYAALIICTTVLTSFCHTTMFVSLAAYFVKISDPKYGGTYLTLLNTLSNFAGMWPKLPVMSAVDWLSVRSCTKSQGLRICTLEYDGFYIVATSCLMIGLLAFQFWIKPAIRKLEIIPKHQWTVHSNSLVEISNNNANNNKN